MPLRNFCNSKKHLRFLILIYLAWIFVFLTEILFRNSKLQAIEIDMGKERKKARKSKQKKNIAQKYLKNLISNRSWLSRRDVMSSQDTSNGKWSFLNLQPSCLKAGAQVFKISWLKNFFGNIYVVGLFFRDENILAKISISISSPNWKKKTAWMIMKSCHWREAPKMFKLLHEIV